jgi:hypothetical protein
MVIVLATTAELQLEGRCDGLNCIVETSLFTHESIGSLKRPRSRGIHFELVHRESKAVWSCGFRNG